MPKSARPYNFSAGPAALPEEVLQRASAEMLDWHGSGMGVMEMSHRGREFGEILAQAQSDLRSLLALPASHHILFMQGGGLAENAIVPLNLSQGRSVDFVITGAWSTKSQQEAQRYCDSRIAYSAEDNGFTSISNPNTWDLSKSPAYVHLCSNETIHGLEFAQLPDLQALGVDAPLVIDCSSHILSRGFAWDKIGLAFAGAQKNIGPAGLTLVIVREDLLDKALPMCPSAFCYGLVAKNASMYNTPPTYAIYIAGLVFQWLQAQGGVAAIEAQNQVKAQLLYAYIDASERYQNRVQPDFRSRMNVPFYLLDDAGNAVVSSQHPLNQAFLQGASARGLLQLKGHVSVGGLRASIYNAMPLAGVQALVNYMQEFEQSL